jgi:tetratricopeptide (TPR) repeat protein
MDMVESSKPSENAPDAPGLAAHMALGESGPRAQVYLDEQTRLTRLQIEQLEEENATRQSILKLEQASAAMKVAFELAVAIIFTLIAVGLGWAVWEAARDNGLVVESFSVPPDLAGRGLTGEVVAAKLLDKLQLLQTLTVSNRASSSYANNWGSDIKLQIPDTGVSIGEFNHSLHAWLGHQTRITGEVWRTPAGLAVTARAGSETSPTFTGGEADLDKLIRQAAESIYRATQPYRYAVYLNNVGRLKESEAAYAQLIVRGSPTDRAWANIGIENIYANRGDYALVHSSLANALAIKPNFVMVYINLAGMEAQLQHDEQSYAAMRKAMEIAHATRDPDFADIPWQQGILLGDGQIANDTGDYQRQIALNKQLEALPEFNGQVENARQNDEAIYALLHDKQGADAAMAALPPTSDPQTLALRDANHAFTGLLFGDASVMLAKHEQFEKLLSGLGFGGVQATHRQFYPFAAYGYALTGDFAKAHAMVDKSPADCLQCVRIRAAIDSMQKDWGGAAYWYARAVRDAPSIPLPWSDWGHMLLDKGDLDGAIAKFERAHALGPNFADPLEMWGEALTRRDRASEALAKFEEAARHAPNWGRLHLKWGEALAATGDKDGAKKQFAIASTLYLLRDEKAELARLN